MYDSKWKEQARETIKRNREALGLYTNDLIINNMVLFNKLYKGQFLPFDTGWILADGLIIGDDWMMEVKSND